MVKVVSVAEIIDYRCRLGVRLYRMQKRRAKGTSNSATRHPIRDIEAEIKSSDEN